MLQKWPTTAQKVFNMFLNAVVKKDQSAPKISTFAIFDTFWT